MKYVAPKTNDLSQRICTEDNTGDVFLYQGLELLGVLVVTFQAGSSGMCRDVCRFVKIWLLQVMRLSAVRSSQDVGQGIERWSQLIGMRSLAATCTCIEFLAPPGP